MDKLLMGFNSYINRYSDQTDTSIWTIAMQPPLQLNKKQTLIVNLDSISIPNLSPSFPYHGCDFYWEKAGVLQTAITLDLTKVYKDGASVVTDLNNLNPKFTGQTDWLFSFNTDTYKLEAKNNTASNLRMVGAWRWGDINNPTNELTAASNVCDRLGFSQNMIGTTIAPGATIVAESPLRLLRTNCYYIYCDLIKNNEFKTPDPLKKGQIICQVSASNFGTLSTFQVINNNFLNTNGDVISSITFSLLDDEFLPISCGNSPITGVLHFSFI
jgi:hypothetical protein